MEMDEGIDEILNETTEELSEEEVIMKEYEGTLQELYTQYGLINMVMTKTVAELDVVKDIFTNNIALLQKNVGEYNKLDLNLKKTFVDEKILNNEFEESKNTLSELNELSEELNNNFIKVDKSIAKISTILPTLGKGTIDLSSDIKNLNKLLEIQQKNIETVSESFVKMNEKINLDKINEYSKAIKEATRNSNKLSDSIQKNASSTWGIVEKYFKDGINAIEATGKMITSLMAIKKAAEIIFNKLTGKAEENNNELKSSIESLVKAIQESNQKMQEAMGKTAEAKEEEAEKIDSGNEKIKNSANNTKNGIQSADEEERQDANETKGSIANDDEEEVEKTGESTTEEEVDMTGMDTAMKIGAMSFDSSIDLMNAALDTLGGPIGLAFMALNIAITEVIEHFSELEKVVRDVCDFVGKVGEDVIKKIHSWGFAALPEKESVSGKNIHHMMVSEFAVTPLDHKVTSVPIVANEGFMSDFSFNMPELNNFDFEGVTDALVEKMMTAIDKVSERPIVTKVQMNNKTIVEATHKQFNNLNGQEAELEARMRGVLVG